MTMMMVSCGEPFLPELNCFSFFSAGWLLPDKDVGPSLWNLPWIRKVTNLDLKMWNLSFRVSVARKITLLVPVFLFSLPLAQSCPLHGRACLLNLWLCTWLWELLFAAGPWAGVALNQVQAWAFLLTTLLLLPLPQEGHASLAYWLQTEGERHIYQEQQPTPSQRRTADPSHPKDTWEIII